MEWAMALAATEGEVTPTAVVDEAAMERNLKRMAELAHRAGVDLRPHAKTHKCRFVAQRQLRHGAIGLTVATLREAECFATAGLEDLLVAHPPVGRLKLRWIGALAEQVPRLAVAVDDLDLATALPASVMVLWEVDSGLHRLGTPPGPPTAEAVLRLADRIGPDRVRGLLTHGGHAYAARSLEQRRRAAEEEVEALRASAAALRDQSLSLQVLSIGATPTVGMVPDLEDITEVRPGTYVFGDANQVALGSHSLEDCAFGVVATVVSTPAPDRAVIDAGSKALSNEQLVHGLSGLGIVLGRPHLRLDRLSEEHGILNAPEGRTGLRVGDRVVVVPTHVCPTVNLHSRMLFFTPSGAHWEAVEARGWTPTTNLDHRGG
jgi:D-serine deaminase-like pyridoxal phosphate-dependent protein